MTCPHAVDDYCEISTAIAGGLPVLLNQAACQACAKHHPVFENPVTVSRAAGALRRAGREDEGRVIADRMMAPEQSQGSGRERVSINVPVENLTREERRARVEQRTAHRRRLIDWVMSCRQDGERGLGDVLVRMIKQARGKEIRADLRRLLKTCACREADAVGRLNAQYPADGYRLENIMAPVKNIPIPTSPIASPL